MDPGTGLALLGTAKLVEKLLGPTAEYLGDNLRVWTEKQAENTKRIFQHFERKLGDGIHEPGAVHPRVLKNVLQDGSFSDDELAAEYFGGVLASSRSGVSRDDRGATFAALIGRLTTYQLRTHFFFYQIVKRVFEGTSENLMDTTGRANLRLFIPFDCYVEAMQFEAGESESVILNHALFGLAKDSLIEPAFQYGPQVFEGRAGITFSPSVLGVELFVWAHGQGNLYPRDFLLADWQFPSETDIKIIPGFLPCRPESVPALVNAKQPELSVDTINR